jgi:very-short-patch-repair endonuclease
VAWWRGFFGRRHRWHRVGPYDLDFFCRAAAVGIEVDGEAHDRGDRPERDARRDVYVADKGIRTLRCLANDVLRHLDAVAAEIGAVRESRLPQR